MWLFTRYGFFSVSAVDKKKLAIRARSRRHLELLRNRLPFLKRYSIEESPLKDYRYRMTVPKNVWVDAMMTLCIEQRWGNFKNEAERFQHDLVYNEALHDIWHRMFVAGTEWEKEEDENAEGIVHEQESNR